MKKTIATLALAAAGAFATSAQAADVGVSVTVGQPGFYGHIDIGDFPQPAVIYRQPRIVERVVVDEAPLYLRVPPGHYRHWDKHCAEYDACGRRVFFVRDSWYNNVYVPRYRERHGDEYRGDREGGEHHGHGNGHGHGHGHDHDD